MANKKNHRQFGHVRKLPSKRFQASYLGPDGQRRNAPETFPTKTDATAWLSTVEADLLRGEWVDPLLGKIALKEYGERWIKERDLGVRTREEYARLFRLHVAPFLGARLLTDISPAAVRTWRANLLDNGRSETTTAKAYRLLRAIMNTALDDHRIKRNPCRIKGADQEKAPERPVASIEQVFTLAEAVPPRFRVLILAAAFTGLRWGELIALRRCDVDLDGPTVRVPRRLAQLSSGKLVEGPPKSAAGFRTVALPDILVDDFRRHLMAFVKAGPEELIFTGEKGAPLKRGNWHRSVKWIKTVDRAGLPKGFHFHDLRHTGNNLAAAAGASTRELMHRMGHGSMRAALIYQHATSERDREIAGKLSKRVKAARRKRS
ncbi:integrase [Saccharothrix tamanrassetensis]|uniref:Integrase n=1 Tax=Saccharothrix tamanrassetensis TaxID=1051531 RepID=A0A841CQC7_9PSEU|nr:site-specific integrase [Saccharothrix tamanrassetensis]MBB5957706.1 integrase [Saccharothrix tamanrassetensis]